MKSFFIIMFIILRTLATDVGNSTSIEWDKFQVKYNKSYGDGIETTKRYKIFTDNLQIISEHNLKHDVNRSSFQMNVNEYTDRTSMEVQLSELAESNYTLMDEEIIIQYRNYFERNESAKVPNEIDWRLRGAVTAVKNQLPCGSCWAFSAAGALEGQYFKKTGKLISLSAQSLVDCTTISNNMGCNGGSPLYSYIHVSIYGGIETEASYPYEGVDGKCRFNRNNVEMTCDGFGEMNRNEDSLKQAVAQIGPISVLVQVNENLQHYDSGIYYAPDWEYSVILHSMLIVGYGTDNELKQDYWILKNSFGSNWGENGYIRMARNRDNNCGIANQAFYPLLK